MSTIQKQINVLKNKVNAKRRAKSKNKNEPEPKKRKVLSNAPSTSKAAAGKFK